MSRKLALMRAAKTAATEKFSPGGWKKTHLAPKPITLATVDLPFLPPPDAQSEPLTHVLELPVPPSLNGIWRTTGAGKGYKSKPYTDWLRQADMAILVDRKVTPLDGSKTIKGHFSVIIDIPNLKKNRDLDNCGKAVLDFLQSRGFVTNDRNCQWELKRRGAYAQPSIRGCRVTLREELA